MRPRLDGIYSPTLPSGYQELPINPANCWIVVHADIGVEGENGSDCFTAYVTTPKFLESSISKAAPRLGRGLIVVSEFDWLVVEHIIKKLCSELEGTSWYELVEKLSRYFLYEYE